MPKEHELLITCVYTGTCIQKKPDAELLVSVIKDRPRGDGVRGSPQRRITAGWSDVQAQNGTLAERVHSHKWHASTIIMRGQYAEKRFAVHDLNDKEMKVKITQASPLVLWAGETNSRLMGVPHPITTQRGSSIPRGMPSRMPTGLKNKRSWGSVI